MGFFRSIAHFVSQPLHTIANTIPGGDIVVPAALALVPGVGPALSAAYAGTDAYAHGASPGQAIAKAGINYVGGKVGSSIGSSIGSNLGTVGDAASKVGVNLGKSVAGDSIGNFLGNVAPEFASNVAKQSIGGAIGGYIGSNIAGNGNVSTGQGGQAPGVSPFVAKQEDVQARPASLSSLGGLTAGQEATNLANQGVYGSGNGPEEQSYYLNLLNRRLVDTGGAVNDNADIAPIERSYLQRLGIDASGNSSNLLEAISRWRQNQAA